jgi:8-oxo-dGTP pyrophosphatase MutT (NUDIX family)
VRLLARPDAHTASPDHADTHLAGAYCASWIAVQAMSLELPGGRIDREDASIADAGVRELLEETGYEAPHLELIATLSIDPRASPDPFISCVRRHAHLLGRAARAR